MGGRGRSRGGGGSSSCTTEVAALGLAVCMVIGLYLLLQHPTTSEVVEGVERRSEVRQEQPEEGNNFVEKVGRKVGGTEDPKWATASGTARFAAKYPPELYRASPFEADQSALTLASFGMGTYLGEVDDRTDALVAAALEASVRAGLNHVDTASNYRKGRAEATIGRTLRKLFEAGAARRDEIVVATKAGFVSSPEVKEAVMARGASEADFDSSGRHCVSPACVRGSLDVSLRRLGLDCVDVLYLHNVAEKRQDLTSQALHAVLAAAFAQLEAERNARRIRFYGLATFSASFRAPPGARGALRLDDVVDLARNAARDAGRDPNDHGFRFVQLPVSADMPEMFDRRWERRQTETLGLAARRLGIALVSSKSLGVPARKKKNRKTPVLCPDDSAYRHVSSDPGALALHLSRSAPGLTTALVGHKSDAHVRANLALVHHPPLTPDAFKAAVARCLDSG